MHIRRNVRLSINFWFRWKYTQPGVVSRLLTGCLAALAVAAAPAWAADAAPANSKPNLQNLSSISSIKELKEFANEKYWSADYAAAQAATEELLDRTKCSLKKLDHECLEIYMNQAVCWIRQNDPERAKRLLKKLLKFAETEKTDTNFGMDEPDTMFFLGECYYRVGNYKQAEDLYRQALAKYRALLPPLSDELFPCLNGLAGCLCRRNDYDDAVPIFTELVKIDALNRGADHLTTAWSLLNLANVLERVGRKDDAKELFEKAVYTFRQDNANHILAEHAAKRPSDADSAALKKAIENLVFGLGRDASLASGGKAFAAIISGIDFSKKPPPRPFDFYNWRLDRARLNEAPGLVTANPDLPLKGLIICVHGLGLHHGTYGAFAQKMADKGFAVVAFDVRGFGSYKESKGYDKVDLKNWTLAKV
jgi:tetratricopeptide (TPR) repeat protein